MPEVEVRKVVLINNGGINIPVFTQNINVDFIPDEMIVREVGYAFDGTQGLMQYVWSNIVDDNVIALIGDTRTAHCPNTTFTVKKEIKGSYLFQIREYNNNIIAALPGNLLIVLEFVKYKQKGRIY
jgi:hypothetical protein